MKRSSVVPTPDEMRSDKARVARGPDGVVAAVDIRPFTRVAVCVGRVFATPEHKGVYTGQMGDPWEQWTFKRGSGGNARQGYVVTPGLPGGALDPEFADLSASPFLGDAQDREPECVYVLNYPKGRLEYWVGRRGARKGQALRLCYRYEASPFPVVYLMYGMVPRPVSANELASSATGLRILDRYGGWNKKQHRALLLHWAGTYAPTKEVANIAMFKNANNGTNTTTTTNATTNANTTNTTTTNANTTNNNNNTAPFNRRWTPQTARRDRVRANVYWSLPPHERQVSKNAAPISARRVANKMESKFLARGVHRVCAKMRNGTYNPTTITRYIREENANTTIAELSADVAFFVKHFIPNPSTNNNLQPRSNHRWYPLKLLELVWDVAEHGRTNKLAKKWTPQALQELRQHYHNDPTVSKYLAAFPNGNFDTSLKIAMRDICNRCCRS